jgi:acetyl-CoA carboxylase biotin carboxylase subunit
MKKIEKILVANRGEIAVRVMRSAREMGIKTVAIYSDADAEALHLRFADECYPLRRGEIEPYLDMSQIIGIALRCGADAIHPGYGFLSENPDFAFAVYQNGLTFIGPTHETIRTMGDKLAAKKLANAAGVPVIPGFLIDETEGKYNFENKANALGYPLMIKARAGGGGKGMRLVWSGEQLLEEIELAISEARDAFGDGRIFLEKYIENPRHIEFQIMADQSGNTIHLFERECSIQRRHQKVVEEAPSSLLDDGLRNEMGACAVTLAKACEYVNAGTIEFIVDSDLKFYFLEMNTRLQVEHPVTEFITGIDLVKEQVRIAEGHDLSITQDDLKINGHAIEVRICAEDPANDFLPDIGELVSYRPARGVGVRVDDGYEEGMQIPLDYDPLIGKLIAHGNSRSEAISRMKRAIGEYQLAGVKNTLGFCHMVMDDPDFCAGNIDTNFISRKLKSMSQQAGSQGEKTKALAAAVLGFELFNGEIFIKPRNLTNCQSNWRNRLK